MGKLLPDRQHSTQYTQLIVAEVKQVVHFIIGVTTLLMHYSAFYLRVSTCM